MNRRCAVRECEDRCEEEIRAIVDFFVLTNPTWSGQRCKDRARIEWSKGFRLVDEPDRPCSRLVLMQGM